MSVVVEVAIAASGLSHELSIGERRRKRGRQRRKHGYVETGQRLTARRRVTGETSREQTLACVGIFGRWHRRPLVVLMLMVTTAERRVRSSAATTARRRVDGEAARGRLELLAIVVGGLSGGGGGRWRNAGLGWRLEREVFKAWVDEDRRAVVVGAVLWLDELRLVEEPRLDRLS